jgi:soluble lytic murein transglycosylase-like protein
MTMRSVVCASFAIMIATSAGAQVLEIASDGTVQTFDGPTKFTNEGATALRASRASTASTGDPSKLVAEAAKSHGIDPGLLQAVARQESSFRMQAVSDKGAIGLLQLMPSTAAELGVDPTDPADNVRGGALYLRRQLDRFGSVPLALAAYNAGPGAVIRYHGVPPFAETRGYVASIMQHWRPAHPSTSDPVSPSETPAAFEVPRQ